MVHLSRDGVSFRLREPFDFSFLGEYGKMFCVFDENDSGNISFGVQDGRKRYFIKVGGAETVNKSELNPTEAVLTALRSAAGIYDDLRHPTLINLLDHREIPGGYILVFEWTEGECMNAHWTYDTYPKYTHEKSAFYRYVRLPLGELTASLTTLFDFHCFAAEKGYVAVDFYDGSVMYDFASHTTRICDIDFYKKMPYANDMGRLWGSSRFMSPEEFTLGAPIDEVSNVFCMGATAFVFLGGEKDRSFEKWRGGHALYSVALKAVNPVRGARYASIAEFLRAWQGAAGC